MAQTKEAPHQAQALELVRCVLKSPHLCLIIPALSNTNHHIVFDIIIEGLCRAWPRIVRPVASPLDGVDGAVAPVPRPDVTCGESQ